MEEANRLVAYSSIVKVSRRFLYKYFEGKHLAMSRNYIVMRCIMANILSTRFNVATWLKDDRADRCDHVQAGTEGYAVFCEDDSFGPVDRYVVCKPCYDESQEELHYEPCNDCKEQKKVKEIHAWKWYDFYGPQGDEPLYICTACWELPKHVARKAADVKAREWELNEWSEYG